MPKAKRKRATNSSSRASRSASPARSSRLSKDAISRVTLGREVQKQVDRFGLTRELAAIVVGDAATQMSRLMHGHFAEFSADRLAKMLTRLGTDVTITLRHASKLGRRGKVRIKATPPR